MCVAMLVAGAEIKYASYVKKMREYMYRIRVRIK